MIEFEELPHGPLLSHGQDMKGITVVDHTEGVEAIVAEFHDNFDNGRNRVHRFVSLFRHAERMETLLKDLAASVTLDARTLARLQEQARRLGDDIEREEKLSNTDRGIQSLQAHNDPRQEG
ncbi:hypothetical protein [Noviherbaspirillum galbum]|uniref:Uncharacterized protein n=1 Tax=Noviherbaspirillum galbum TaxID=2709383 RepID=A0A6B3SHM8_9BURK|nr:hypothetical protein [Noviherbaspirillum galbum]NEX60160.1 hypothetical protein [Noviherbaspirillum galbum]